MFVIVLLFFFSSRRRHTRCALVTGVQTCALPISGGHAYDWDAEFLVVSSPGPTQQQRNATAWRRFVVAPIALVDDDRTNVGLIQKVAIGRASCRERVCQYV